jgi:diamine N-acetyltransferase
MPDPHFLEGGAELLDTIGPLWQKLTLHHSGISAYFGDQFAAGKFPERKQDLQEKAAAGKLRTVLASAGNSGPCIGYCVAVIDAKRNGEIESLYVEDAYRNRGVGSGLVERILAWFDRERTVSASVNVAVGNESAFRFYEQWGFYPRVTVLVRKEKQDSPQTQTQE